MTFSFSLLPFTHFPFMFHSGMAFALISKSKSPSEAERCLELVLPVAVLQGATAANRNVRQAAKNFVRRSMESREGDVGGSAMEAYGKAAVGSEDSRTAIAACKAVPDIFDNRKKIAA